MEGGCRDVYTGLGCIDCRFGPGGVKRMPCFVFCVMVLASAERSCRYKDVGVGCKSHPAAKSSQTDSHTLASAGTHVSSRRISSPSHRRASTTGKLPWSRAAAADNQNNNLILLTAFDPPRNIDELS